MSNKDRMRYHLFNCPTKRCHVNRHEPVKLWRKAMCLVGRKLYDQTYKIEVAH